MAWTPNPVPPQPPPQTWQTEISKGLFQHLLKNKWFFCINVFFTFRRPISYLKDVWESTRRVLNIIVFSPYCIHNMALGTNQGVMNFTIWEEEFVNIISMHSIFPNMCGSKDKYFLRSNAFSLYGYIGVDGFTGVWLSVHISSLNSSVVRGPRPWVRVSVETWLFITCYIGPITGHKPLSEASWVRQLR